MPNKKISQLDVRSSPTLADLLAIADPSTGYAYKITGTSLQTVLEIPNKVPYTGATSNVNLGAYNITATNIIRAGGLATQFLKADGSVDSTTYMNRAVYDTDGNGVVDAAEKMQTIGRNSTGVTLYKGTIVYISGSTGNRPNFVKAQANSEATSAGTFGVVVSDIANNSDGYVATIGTLADLDTRTTATNPFTSVTLADGDTIYLDPNTAGYVTNVKPSAPNHIVYVGKVVRTSPTLGTIVYRIQNGYELNEIHDVAISSVANNDVLVYETATTLWKNKSIATILGYTPQAQLNGTGFVKATGTTISYDNTTYATDSLVVHLAGAETITGVKTFQNALQTTAGNNLLNTGGGNTVIGYTADPASSATYKLDVNGSQKIAGGLFVFGGTYTSGIGMIWKDSAYGLAISGSGTNYSTSLFSSGGLYVFRVPQGGQLIEFVGSQRNLGAIQQNSGHNFLNYADSSTYIGYTSVQPTVYKLDVNGTARIVSNLNLAAYTTSSSVPGTVAGLLGFDSSGNVITSAAGVTGSGTAGQVTYWSGTSAVTGSATLTYTPTTSLLVNNSVTASGSIARGVNFTPTLVAAANNDVLVGLDVAPTFTNGAFTGLSNILFRARNSNTTRTEIFSRGSQAWYISTGTTEIGKISYETPGGFPGIILWTGATYNQNRFNLINNGTHFSLAFDADSGGDRRLSIFTNGVAINSNTNTGYNFFCNGSMRVGTTAASAMYWDDTNARLIIGNTSGTARLDVGASTTSASALRIRSGTAPTSPNDGDIWYDGTNIKIQVGASTKTFTII